ncbi:MAG: hypothetical protein QW039_04110 [Fervidicoccaceae archaeon]
MAKVWRRDKILASSFIALAALSILLLVELSISPGYLGLALILGLIALAAINWINVSGTTYSNEGSQISSLSDEQDRTAEENSGEAASIESASIKREAFSLENPEFNESDPSSTISNSSQLNEQGGKIEQLPRTEGSDENLGTPEKKDAHSIEKHNTLRKSRERGKVKHKQTSRKKHDPKKALKKIYAK